MKILVLFSFFLINIPANTIAQTDDALMKEIESKLQKGSSVSQILVDKKYASLHPAATFREIIKRYAAIEVLSIVCDTIPGRKIKIIGTVKTNDGKPVAGITVYL